MALNVTRLALRNRALSLADMTNSSFRTVTQANDLINVHLCTLVDLLVEAGPADYYSSSATINVVTGTVGYNLPADFRSLTGVFEVVGTRKREIDPMRPGRFSDYDTPTTTTVQIEYIPAPQQLTDDTDPVVGTFDAVAGWDELVVAYVARDLLAMEESDIGAVNLKIQELTARIRSAASKRYRGTQMMTDVYGGDVFPFATSSNIAGWRLRGSQLELYRAADRSFY